MFRKRYITNNTIAVGVSNGFTAQIKNIALANSKCQICILLILLSDYKPVQSLYTDTGLQTDNASSFFKLDMRK